METPGPLDALTPCQRTVVRVKIHLAKRRAATRRTLRWTRRLADRLRRAFAAAPPALQARLLAGDPQTAPLAALWLNVELVARTAEATAERLNQAHALRRRQRADLERRVTFIVKRQIATDDVFALAEEELRTQGQRCGRRLLHKTAWSVAGRLGYTDVQREQITETAARHYLAKRRKGRGE
ncbi:hypothetical protein [Halochromatium glycolicum]|uniref:Uncharacterized protein n=1 Tax=Halochromatium glycolicum TaxID=85075 RepID=A0AAJ0X9T4_9GAMM|nr:hypothetical protein [Halochromatium glycolicum]MBK1705111.1 hypothetical protein [Halochromatium glycolicum]